MMPITSAQHANMQRGCCIVCERPQKMLVQCAGEPAFVVRPPTHIDRRLNQGIVHWNDCMSVTTAGLGKLILECQTERNGDVLYQVVAQISGRLNRQDQSAV